MEDDDIQKLFDISGYIFKKCSPDCYSNKFNVLATASLVLMGCEAYDDGNFWGKIKDRIGTNVNQNKLGQVFRSVLGAYGLPIVEGTGRKNVNNIIMHTLVPDCYLNDFFDFIFNFYKEILGYQLDENLENEFAFLANHVSSTLRNELMQKDDSSLSLYRLLIPTRYALSDVTFFGDLLKRILCLIDARYWGKPLLDDVNLRRYEDPFNEWFELRDRPREKGITQESYIKSLKPSLIKGPGSIKLFIPSQRITENRLGTITIESEDGVIQSIDIDSYPLGPWKKTYPVDKPLDQLGLQPFERFIVRLDNRLIYTNKPEKGFLIFNESGLLVENPVEGLNHVLVNEGMEFDSGDSNYNLDYMNEYKLYSLFLEQADYLLIGGVLFLVGDSGDSSYKDYPMEGVYYLDESGECKTFVNRHPVLFLKKDSMEKTDHLRVLVGGITTNINLTEYWIKGTKNESGIMKVSLQDHLILDSDGECNVSLIGRDFQRNLLNYYLIQDFTFRLDKDFYLNSDCGTVILSSNTILPTVYRWRGDSFQFVMKAEPQKTIYIPTPILKISVHDGKWMTTINNIVHLKDMIDDHICIRLPGANTITMYVGEPFSGVNKRKIIDGVFFDDAFYFNIVPLKDLMKRRPELDYTFEISINHNQRIEFMKVKTHLKYRIKELDDRFIITVLEPNIPDEINPIGTIIDAESGTIINSLELKCGENCVEKGNTSSHIIEISENHMNYFGTTTNKILKTSYGKRVYVDIVKSKTDRQYTYVCYEGHWLPLQNNLLDPSTGMVNSSEAERDFHLKVARNGHWLNKEIYEEMIQCMKNYLHG